ncbi:hypothetical protein [Leifsonia sp. fls2-241-R2A-40a]|uniref:hypothetical protein n=1 Tax=Leifsonia sp. fls2-241-R2A-40a TaxID=3040290 RepID=UPI00254A1B24|nr:hypothetical protein [Leifsonia sp. fls2-241-R2A-40a]
MSAHDRLRRFLDTEAADAGCAKTMSLMHVFADLALTGADPGARYPDVAVHLAHCAACGEDYRGLLAALQ